MYWFTNATQYKNSLLLSSDVKDQLNLFSLILIQVKTFTSITNICYHNFYEGNGKFRWQGKQEQILVSFK